MKESKPFKMIMFDMDGVIVDTFRFHVETLKKFFDQFNANISTERIKTLVGTSLQNLFDKTIPAEKHQDAFEKITTYYKNEINDFLHFAVLSPSFKELVLRLKEKGVKIALVTNSKKEIAYKILEYNKVKDLFDYLAPANNVELTKHERCRIILDRFCLEPNDILFIGDLPTDIALAKDMGFSSCLIYNEVSWLYPKYELAKASNADYVISDLQEINNIADPIS